MCSTVITSRVILQIKTQFLRILILKNETQSNKIILLLLFFKYKTNGLNEKPLINKSLKTNSFDMYIRPYLFLELNNFTFFSQPFVIVYCLLRGLPLQDSPNVKVTRELLTLINDNLSRQLLSDYFPFIHIFSLKFLGQYSIQILRKYCFLIVNLILPFYCCFFPLVCHAFLGIKAFSCFKFSSVLFDLFHIQISFFIKFIFWAC